MTWLSLLLIAKIGLTAVFVAAPLMLLPKAALERSLGVAAPTPKLFRLYGVAVAALLVGYAFGIPAAEAGRFPWGVVCMGVVSNGGASVLLAAYSPRRKQDRVSAAFFGLVALGLIAAIVAPASAMQSAW